MRRFLEQMSDVQQQDVKINDEKSSYVSAMATEKISGLRRSVVCLAPLGKQGAIGCSYTQIIYFHWDEKDGILNSQILFNLRNAVSFPPNIHFSSIINISAQNQLVVIARDNVGSHFLKFQCHTPHNINHCTDITKHLVLDSKEMSADTVGDITISSAMHNNIKIDLESRLAINDQVSFFTSVFHRNKMLALTKSGDVYLIDCKPQGISATQLHGHADDKMLSVKLLESKNKNATEYLEYLTVSHNKKTICKWLLKLETDTKITKQKIWGYATPDNLTLLNAGNSYACVLRNDLLIVLVEPIDNPLPHKHYIHQLDKNNGTCVNQIHVAQINNNPEDRIACLAAHPNGTRALLCTAQNRTGRVETSQENGIKVSDLQQSDYRGLQYRVEKYYLGGDNETLYLSDGVGLIAINTRTNTTQRFTNFSLTPEHFGASAYTFLPDDRILLCHHESSKIVIKANNTSYNPKKAMFTFLLGMSYAKDEKSLADEKVSAVSVSYARHPLYEPCVNRIIAEFLGAEPITDTASGVKFSI